jgi:hypothetical protein
MRGEHSRLTGTDLENGFSLVAGAKPYFSGHQVIAISYCDIPGESGRAAGGEYYRVATWFVDSDFAHTVKRDAFG